MRRLVELLLVVGSVGAFSQPVFAQAGGMGDKGLDPITEITDAPPYYWSQIPNSTRVLLFRGSQRIGVYDHATQEFRRIETDGKLSEPVPFPWSQNKSRVSKPPLAAPPKADKASDTDQSIAVHMPYLSPAMGGGVTAALLIMLLVLRLCRRDQRPGSKPLLVPRGESWVSREQSRARVDLDRLFAAPADNVAKPSSQTNSSAHSGARSQPSSSRRAKGAREPGADTESIWRGKKLHK